MRELACFMVENAVPERGMRSGSTAASGWRRVEHRLWRGCSTSSPRRRARRARRSSTIVRRGFEVETKQRSLAGHRSRPRGRADHPRRAGARCARRSGDRRGGGRRRPNPGARRHLFPGRSARRDQGIRPRRRRLHGQHRADRATACRSSGVVFAPATGRLHGGLVGEGAWLEDGERPHARSDARAAASELTAVASKSHFNQATVDYLARRRSALRLCRRSARR